MIIKYIIAIMVVIVMVCSLSFCEKPMIEQKSPIKNEVKQEKKTEIETKADPQGFGGMF